MSSSTTAGRSATRCWSFRAGGKACSISSLTGALIGQMLTAETIGILLERGHQPPILISAKCRADARPTRSCGSSTRVAFDSDDEDGHTNDAGAETRILIASELYLPGRVAGPAAVVVADGIIQAVWRDVDTRTARATQRNGSCRRHL